MNRKEAIESIENSIDLYSRRYATGSGYFEGDPLILTVDEYHSLKTLLSTTKNIEEVVGKCKEEIEYYRKSLENENNKNRIKLKELALHFYEGMLALLTEEE